MSRDYINDILTDRERILLRIIEGLSMTQTLVFHAWEHSHEWGDHVHIAAWAKPQPGDLVIASTGGVGSWKVGFYVEERSDLGGAVIREIGTGRLCNYGNESFRPIRGLSAIDLLEGEQRIFYYTVLRAFAKADEYVYRFGGIRFEGEVCHVTIREVFGGIGRDSVPFTVPVPWGKRTSVKAVLKALRDGGLGTKSFRTEPVAA